MTQDKARLAQKELTDLLEGIKVREIRLRWHIMNKSYNIVEYLLPIQARDLVALHDTGMNRQFDTHFKVYCQLKIDYEKVKPCQKTS